MSKTRRKPATPAAPRQPPNLPASDSAPDDHAKSRQTEENPPADEQGNDDQQAYNPATGCLLRVFWIMVGNLALLFCAVYIAQNATRLVGVADAVYWAIIGSLLAARYVDIRHFQGRTAEGEPASMAHWRRYAGLLVAVSAGLWLAAHLAAYFTA